MNNGIAKPLNNKATRSWKICAMVACALAFAHFKSAALAQSELPAPGQDWGMQQNVGSGTFTNSKQHAASTSLVQEQAEQNTIQVAQRVEQKLWPASYSYDEVYQGLGVFWSAYPGYEFDDGLNAILNKTFPHISFYPMCALSHLLRGIDSLIYSDLSHFDWAHIDRSLKNWKVL